MKGFPKTLSTKEDYLYCKAHFPKERWQPEFQQLLDERFDWLNTGKLKADETGLDDKTHRVVNVEDEREKTVEKYQQEYGEDSNAKLFRLGFTVDEVGELINPQIEVRKTVEPLNPEP
ncbi:MAG: hypothetical protein JRC60_00200 [Deltaproteobacteria bacterium]|nr:hypothetical protein [Deltaproteobacteria bacterium]